MQYKSTKSGTILSTFHRRNTPTNIKPFMEAMRTFPEDLPDQKPIDND